MKNLKIISQRLTSLWLALFVTLFCSILILNSKVTKAQVSAVDSLALVALYNSTDGANWTDNTNWLTGPVSTWYGITVTDTNVTDITLFNSNLTGTIPIELGNLTNLTGLNLNSSQLTGTIPVELGNLTNLQSLNLNSNLLTGTIPVELGSLTNLQYLSLYNNQLTGTIPVELGNLSNLEHLWLYDNQLTGAIPDTLGTLTNLQSLYLYNNQLTGAISVELGNLTNLVELYLNNNQLTGAIPDTLGTLTNLQYFFINDNAFTDLPALSALTSLDYFYIENNKFTFEDIESNIAVASVSFIYSPQDSVLIAFDTIINPGDTFILSALVGGANNVYQWYKDGDTIVGEINSTYTIDSAEIADEGIYTCEITNTVATDLTLYRRPVNVLVNPVGISEQQDLIGINIYPNPNRGIITLSNFGNTNVYELKIIAPQGRIVYSEIITLERNDVKQINLHNLSKGIYFLKVQSGKSVETRKIIVQ